MNGAQALINTLVDGGVDVCFANPGTSEMHFVAALDAVPRMRGMLTLFEGVATGAADGYARIAGRPAAVLLHLGPGLGNGLANLHNARRARVPMVVVVGDHATYHKKYDAPLESDIDAVAGTVSGWVRRTEAAADVGADAEAAIAASRSGSQIATLILPADVCWSDGAHAAAGVPAQAAAAPVDVGPVAGVLRSGEPAMMLIGGDATRGPGLTAAARIVQATGARWLCETFPTCLERGAGIPAVERLAYFAEGAAAQLDGVKHLVLAGARSPVSFFAYPGMPSDLVPAGCEVVEAAADAFSWASEAPMRLRSVATAATVSGETNTNDIRYLAPAQAEPGRGRASSVQLLGMDRIAIRAAHSAVLPDYSGPPSGQIPVSMVARREATGESATPDRRRRHLRPTTGA